MKRSTLAWLAMVLGGTIVVSACKAKEATVTADAAVAAVATLAPGLAPPPVETAVAPAGPAVAKAEPKPLGVGSKLQIEWKGKGYPGVITQVVGKDRYKIRYDGYGNEWDGVIGPSRILARR